jgi:hypothetical protein
MLRTDEPVEQPWSPHTAEQTTKESTRREFLLGTLAATGLLLTSQIGSAGAADENHTAQQALHQVLEDVRMQKFLIYPHCLYRWRSRLKTGKE